MVREVHRTVQGDCLDEDEPVALDVVDTMSEPDGDQCSRESRQPYSPRDAHRETVARFG